MAELNPPAWLEGGAHPARLDRALIATLIPTSGIIEPGHLAPSETPTPSMAVRIASGRAIIPSDSDGVTGVYHVVNDGAVDLTIAPADATNARIDRIVARVVDSFYLGGDDDEWRLEVVTGTPGSSPTEPTLPADAIEIARVDVGAGAGQIEDADIVDRRPMARSRRALFQDGLREVVTFTSGGTFVKANYPWLRAVRVLVQGAGGAGGGAQTTASGESSFGDGGGAGGFGSELIDVDDLAPSTPVTVGVGGQGVVGGVGGNGGSSSFGSVTATGGSGGAIRGATNSNATTPVTIGGGEGGQSTATVRQPGQPGGRAVAIVHGGASGLISGQGGSSRMGGGGRQRSSSSVGDDGTGYGGGGSGGTSAGAAGGNVRGGHGRNGVVVVELYG